MAKSTRQFSTLAQAAIRALCVWLLLAICLSAAAEQIKLDELNVRSRVYKKVTVLGFNATDVYFTHSKGITNVKLKYLDADLQKLFHYDEEAAKEAEHQQILDNAEFNKQLVETIENNAAKARKLEMRREMASDANLADPLSDKSPIGRKLPELKVEHWIGGKPETRDRFQLIYLWAPWSPASKKFITEMNALQAKFTKEITFFSVVSEESNDPDTEAGVKTEFPAGIEPTEKFIQELGVTSVPQVILADAKGVVRYIGHPGALSETRLQELVTRFGE